MAPHLLKNRFPHPEYYTHLINLQQILKITLQFSLTQQDITTLDGLIQEWVEEYER